MTTSVKEIWKDVVGYEGLYEVSNLGKVRSVSRGNRKGRVRVLYQSGRYLDVVLSKEGKHKTHDVHRLVAMAFIPNPNNKAQIDHIDGNSINNNVTNLRWATPKENNNNPITIQRNHEAKIGMCYRKGYHHSEETKRKISLGNKGKQRSQEYRDMVSAFFKGKKQSQQQIDKVAKSHWIKVCQYTIDGKLVMVWDSLKQAAKSINIDRSQISHCCRGRGKTAGGYIWKYKE